jgi:hypothetical protein
MDQLKFALTFKGGKAEKHRVSARRLAEIMQSISDDILDVCRIISHDDLNIDWNEIARGCRLYVVGNPQPSSLSLSFETEPVGTKWPVEAGRIFASSLYQLPIEDNGDIPLGINRRILEHAKEYCSPANGEYETMMLTIQANGRPEMSLIFDQKLKVAVEKKLIEIASPNPNIIHGYEIQGILYGLEDQDYDDPLATVTVEVDPGDGTRWMCHIKRDLVPKDIADHWTERVLVSGTAKLKKRKPEMEVEGIELLGKKPDIEDALEKFISASAGVWEGEHLSSYMNRVRERDE